jgi:choline kinase
MNIESARGVRDGRVFARLAAVRHNRRLVTPIRVAILAAGRGHRLTPLTDDWPKCLLAIDGISPLGFLLDRLNELREVGEVWLVVGHAAERVESFVAERSPRFATRIVRNPQFDSANNIVSAALLREPCAGGFLLVNSDVLCDPAILAIALDETRGSFLMVDPARPIRDEAMKVRFADGRLTAIAKDLPAETADGEYIGIARFDEAGARAFFTAVDAIVGDGGRGEWYEAAIGRAARTIAIAGRSIGERAWIEIDDHQDLARAREQVLPRIRRATTAFASGHS